MSQMSAHCAQGAPAELQWVTRPGQNPCPVTITVQYAVFDSNTTLAPSRWFLVQPACAPIIRMSQSAGH